MPIANPFQAPSGTQTRQGSAIHLARQMAAKTAWWTLFLQPIWLVLAITACWLLTAVTNDSTPGRGEVPEAELPRLIESIIGDVAGYSMLAIPLIIPAMMLWTVVCPFGSPLQHDTKKAKRLACLGTYGLLWGLLIAWAIFDPCRAFIWFID